MHTGQSNGGNSSNEVPSSQVTLVCIKLRKTNQHTRVHDHCSVKVSIAIKKHHGQTNWGGNSLFYLYFQITVHH